MDAAVSSRPKTQPSTLLARLRPRDIGGVLDQAVALYRRNFLTYVAIVALMQVPVSLVLTIANILLLDPATIRATPLPPPSGSDPDAYASYQAASVAALADVASRGLLFLVLGILGAILINIATGALARAIAAGYMGQQMGVLDAYRAVRRQWLTLTGLIFITGLSTVLLIVPPLFVWIFVSWIFATQVVVLEGQGVFAALSRSWNLVSGFWWRVFGAYTLLFLINIVVSFSTSVLSPILVALDAPWAVQTIVTEFAGLLVTVLFLPVRLAGMTLLYFDLRVRKEGLDLQMALDQQAAEIGLEPVPVSAGLVEAAWPYRAAAAPAALENEVVRR